MQITPEHCLYQPWLCSTKWSSLQSSFSSCIRWFSIEGTSYDILKATSCESKSVLGTGHLWALRDGFQNPAANKKLQEKGKLTLETRYSVYLRYSGFFLIDAVFKYSWNCSDLDKARQDGRIKDLRVYFNTNPPKGDTDWRKGYVAFLI